MARYKVKCESQDHKGERTFVLELDPADVRKWQTGTLIQYAMPYLSAAERELLISGTCDECFQKLIPPDDEE